MARGKDTGESPETRAQAVLAALESEGLVEFSSSWGSRSMATAFAELMEEIGDLHKDGRKLAEWLMEQDEVAEVYSEDAALAARVYALWTGKA